MHTGNTCNENTHHALPASAEGQPPNLEHHDLIKPFGSSGSSFVRHESSSGHAGPAEDQGHIVDLADRPPFGISENEQSFIMKAADEEFVFRPTVAIHTLLSRSFITAACVASLRLERIPLAQSLQAQTYKTPFGLYDPSHFVALLIQGIENGSPKFRVNVAILDLAISWRNINLFVGEGLRSRANAAIIAAHGLGRLPENWSLTLPPAINIAGVNHQSSPNHLHLGRFMGATLFRSSSGPERASDVGPFAIGRLCPPSRTASRAEAAPLCTPIEAQLCTPPTSLELDELSRFSREAQCHSMFGPPSHDEREASQDKVHPEDGCICAISPFPL